VCVSLDYFFGRLAARFATDRQKNECFLVLAVVTKDR